MASRPAVVILEQPVSRHRFRYASEVSPARTVGSLPGAGSSPERRSYPTVAVPGHTGPMLVVLSLVNPADHLVHPHSVTGTDRRYHCSRGVVYMVVDGPVVTFNNIGILCVKKKSEQAVVDALEARREANLDPFGAGFEHISDHRRIDFDSVRLCFSVSLPGAEWAPARRADPRAYTRRLAPALSDVVQNSAALGELRIVHISSFAGSFLGGTEMILLCDKYSGVNPDVVFEAEGWEARAHVRLYHKQFAVVFDTPRYRDVDVTGPIEVAVSLRRGAERSRPAAAELRPLRARTPAGAARPPPDYLRSKEQKLTLAQRCARVAPPACAESARGSRAHAPPRPAAAAAAATYTPAPSNTAHDGYALPDLNTSFKKYDPTHGYQLNPFCYTDFTEPSTSNTVISQLNMDVASPEVCPKESVTLNSVGPLPNVVPTAQLVDLPPDVLTMSPDVSNCNCDDNLLDAFDNDDLIRLLLQTDEEMLSDELDKLCNIQQV